MNEYKVIENEIFKCFDKIVREIMPMIGKGEKYRLEIDEIATNIFIDTFNKLDDVGIAANILGIEGSRDGVKIPNIKEKIAKYVFVVDPIEGTLTGANGGPRCVSVIGLYQNNKMIKKLPDNIDIFSIGSNISKKLNEFILMKGNINNFNLIKNGEEIITMLHRRETEELLNGFFKMKFSKTDVVGENTMLFENRKIDNIVLVGDSTILCPLESDYYIGRSGSVEGRIESDLWKYWDGLLVSSRKIKEYKGGMYKYFKDRIEWANGSKKFYIENFFQDKDIKQLTSLGWTYNDIRACIKREVFSPKRISVWICSITGIQDNKLPLYSRINLSKASFQNKKISYEILKISDKGSENNVLRRKVNK